MDDDAKVIRFAEFIGFAVGFATAVVLCVGGGAIVVRRLVK